ncbi:WSSV189 [White spot syndrome virus]|uniref:WSSV189 n=1 Tax=White spot syndrome virus TaxID=342409 RepID=A0A2I6SBU8_9VIRU|nr:WSSV189 [White spot syndrome virus]
MKNFSAHSSLGVDRWSRPDVKFEGWTAGVDQCQMHEDTRNVW